MSTVFSYSLFHSKNYCAYNHTHLFSTLWFICRTGDEQLSTLAVISIHKNVAQELNIQGVIDEFSKSGSKCPNPCELNILLLAVLKHRMH